MGFSRRSGNLTEVVLTHLVLWISDAGLQLTVIGQQHQPFGVVIKSACRIHPRNLDEIRQSRAPRSVRELAEDLERLVDQQ